MSWFTVLRADGVSSDGPKAWVIVANAVEAETPDEALEQVIGDRSAGAGEYMIVHVMALRRVKAKTDFSIEPMDPPAEMALPEPPEL